MGRVEHRTPTTPTIVGARPLTALVPIRSGGTWWLAFVFLIARIARRWFFRDVQRIGLVYAMQWSIVKRLPRYGRGDEIRPHLLFESNFAGNWEEYIEGFARTVPRGMKMLFGATVGYPGLSGNARAFTEFVREHDFRADFYYRAYDADSIAVLRSLLVRRLGEPEARPNGRLVRVEPEFSSHRRVPIRRAYRVRSPHQIEVIIEVKPGRAADLRRVIEERERHLQRCFAGASRVHFARLLVVDFDSGSQLVLTATYDAGLRYRRSTRPSRRRDLPRDVDVAVAEILESSARLARTHDTDGNAAAGPFEPDAMRAVLEHCLDYPAAIGDPNRDVESLVAFLLNNQRAYTLLGTLSYCLYPETSVSEVRDALRLYGDRV